MSKKSDAHPLFTNVEAYIRGKYREFSDLLEYCDLYRVMQTRPGSDGITVIIPRDETMKKIRELSFSPDTKKVGDACELLLAHIIRKGVTSADGWKDENIGDSRYPSQRIRAKVTSKGVELQSADGKVYATIKKDEEFRVAFRDRLAVWNVVTGDMREEKGDDAPPKMHGRRGPREKMPVTGGYELEQAHYDTARFKIGVTAENEFVVQQMCRAASPIPPVCPFQSYVISFARFAQEKYPDLFYQCILPLIRFRMIDFYTIFEPHRSAPRDQYLIPDVPINEWWETFKFTRVLMADVMSFRGWVDQQIATAATQYPQVAIYAKMEDLIHEIDGIRVGVTPALQNQAQIAPAIYSIYDAFANSNKIGALADIYPPMLADYYRSHPRFKLAHDELAFVTEPIMIRLCMAPVFNLDQFRHVVTMIGNVMHANSVPDIEKVLPLTSPAKLSLQNDALIEEIRVFVNSTMFLWIPITSETMKNYPIESATTRPETTDVLYNTDFALKLHHERLYHDISSQLSDINKKMFVSMMDSIKPEQITEALRAKLTVLLNR